MPVGGLRVRSGAYCPFSRSARRSTVGRRSGAVAPGAVSHLALSSTGDEFLWRCVMDDAIAVRDLVVDRGGRRVLHGISCRVPRGAVTGLLGPSGSGKTTFMRAVVGVQLVSWRDGHRARPTGGHPRAAAPGGLPDPGAERLRRPDRPGERPLLRGPVRAWARRGRPGDQRRRAGRGGRPTGRHPLRRPAQPSLAGLRPGRGAGAGHPRRADRRAGPGAAGRPVGPVPRDGRRRHHPAGVQPRDGRGGPLRPAAADPRGAADRRRQPRPRSAPPPAWTTWTRRSCG